MAFKDSRQAIKYNNDFISKNYDRINVTIPRGEKDVIKNAAAAAGKTVNEFIREAIREKIAAGTGAGTVQDN